MRIGVSLSIQTPKQPLKTTDTTTIILEIGEQPFSFNFKYFTEGRENPLLS